MSDRSVIATASSVLSSIEQLRMIYDPATQIGRDGQFCSLAQSSLSADVVTQLKGRFASGLYSHQHEAIESVLAGRHTCWPPEHPAESR